MAIEIDWKAEPLSPEEQVKEDERVLYSYLSGEFLTWLVFFADVDGGEFPGFTVRVGNKLSLRSAQSMVSDVTIKGKNPSLSADLLYTMAGGLSVREVDLAIEAGDRRWSFALSSDGFDLKRVKLPELTAEVEEEHVEERAALLWELDEYVKSAFIRFLHLRVTGEWGRETVPAMRAWISDRVQ